MLPFPCLHRRCRFAAIHHDGLDISNSFTPPHLLTKSTPYHPPARATSRPSPLPTQPSPTLTHITLRTRAHPGSRHTKRAWGSVGIGSSEPQRAGTPPRYSMLPPLPSARPRLVPAPCWERNSPRSMRTSDRSHTEEARGYPGPKSASAQCPTLNAFHPQGVQWSQGE